MSQSHCNQTRYYLFHLPHDPLIKEIKISYSKIPENEKANWKQDGYVTISDYILG